MKIRSAGPAVLLVFLVAVGVGNASVPFYGVINTNSYTVTVDTAFVSISGAVDTFLTSGWSGTGSSLDTFHFLPDIAAWPDSVMLAGKINGQHNDSPFPRPLEDTWYRFAWPQIITPSAMFYGPGQGLEESRSAAEPLQRLNVSPTVVTTQMTISVRPAATSRPVVEVLDAAGNLVRSLNCTAGANGLATTTWNREDGRGRLVPRGVYFCRYVAPGAVAVRKVLVAH